MYYLSKFILSLHYSILIFTLFVKKGYKMCVGFYTVQHELYYPWENCNKTFNTKFIYNVKNNIFTLRNEMRKG